MLPLLCEVDGEHGGEHGGEDQQLVPAGCDVHRVQPTGDLGDPVR